MIVDLDVIVGRDTAALPLSVSIGLVRQLLQRRTVDRFQQLPPALGELLHHLGVDRGNAFADFRVQLVEREEVPVPELGQHEPLDDEDSDFHLRLVARLPHACGEHHEAIVVGQVLIGAIDAGFVTRRLGDARLQVVGHRSLRHAADGIERVDVRADPVGQRLGPARLGVGVVGGPERRHEDVGAMLSTRYRIEHRDRVAGPVHEQLVASHVRLAHGRRDALAPFTVELAEPRVVSTPE